MREAIKANKNLKLHTFNKMAFKEPHKSINRIILPTHMFLNVYLKILYSFPQL